MKDDELDIDKVLEAGEMMYNAMCIQEKREVGEFHLSQQAARYIWDTAKKKWEEATR